ncbi:diaminohydroxyphosphoribosylamino-pyrimidine deaminase [Lentinula aciculospora]|uniref:Diaminohydroxyphosphoribosylamino-pyrimidine deaminase n=1 Tax=Lentinula aciculospora TaxID=153920 RepID=A0A9W9DVG7_9AGAR|nr:diaminohydroxyphosphoribosylamino-pyrimidine deaminase [Lentinula aciculospora]
MTSDQHLEFLRLALEEAKKCTPTPTAFCVGCVLVSRLGTEPVVMSTGYSRELPGNTHAEANALSKFRSLSQDQLSKFNPSTSSNADILASADVYTTMEPCSVRTSGLSPCADALIDARVKRCFIGVGEPDDFVHCEGAQKLVNAGIEVIWLKGLEEDSLRVARRGH